MKPTLTKVIVVIGAGSIGQAIARRVSAGNHVLLADLKRENVDATAKVLADAGFAVTTAIVDVSDLSPVPNYQERRPISRMLETRVGDQMELCCLQSLRLRETV